MADSKTVLDYFLDNVEKTPDRRLMTQPMGGGNANLKFWTCAEVLDEAKRMAAYIESLDFEKGSQIAICSKNCAWWVLADLAIWLSGHVSVPVYPTLTADTVQYTLEHSESKLLFVGKLDDGPWDEMKNGVPKDLPTVSFPLCPEGDYTEKWDEVIGKTEPIQEPSKRTMEEMATIIYTSGSTGRPKGVMHSFSTMTAATEGLVKLLDVTSKDRYLSYLPLAHGMERWCGEMSCFVAGTQLFFAETLTTFVDDLNRAHPTIFVSVPRLWTKFQQGVYKKMPPEKLNKLIRIPILGSFVKKKILKGLGLNKVRFAGSGSAPLPVELLQFYRNLGLELLEGYGMTENFNYSHISKPGKTRVGYVGNTYDDVEQRIAEDGEIQVKSPGTMMGYYKNDEATAETMTEDGWLKTGDRGEIDENGRLKITGRTKEIFKTSKGKYVAPAPIENKIIVHPRVELACVNGTGFPMANAILQLNDDAKAKAMEEGGQDTIAAELEKLLAEVNPTLDDHERLQFLVIVKDDWLPENGFLTPTQKIKRSTIEEAYGSNMEAWYDSKKKVIWHGW
mmetsp:Transcript_13669/g.19960  ORF Transcript_13669/g.19960 Transcript_13669/m.19960 type:complete len:562 (-) Transcript_13669:299-1984(-)